MRTMLIFAAMLIPFCVTLASPTIDRGDYERAQSKAKEENKLLFLDFYAPWCAPCKWMDETTFTDEEVKSTLNKNFVAIKVNIDDFEGFDLKSKFDIRYLPTILIFNSEGTMVERVEETLGRTKMLEVLHLALDKNEKEVVHAVNTSPSQIFHSNKKEEVKAVSHPENSDENHEVEKTVFKLQMGVFASLENAKKFSNNLKRKFVEPIGISEFHSAGKMVYKVLMGSFNTKEEAEHFQQLLTRDFKLDSIII